MPRCWHLFHVWIHRVFVLAVVLAAGCANTPDETPPDDTQRGQQLAADLGCANCHSPDGTSRIGPSWAGSWGREIELDDGTRVVFDESYVTRSVRAPGAQRRTGTWVQMPPFGPDRLSDADLAAIIEFLRGLDDA